VINHNEFSSDLLTIDCAKVAAQIETAVREIVAGNLRRRGAVVGLSGGIDSSVSAALCVRALGKDRVLGLFMPEADSDPESLRLGRLLASSLGIEAIVEDIRPILDAAGCYRRRDEAIRQAIPEYGSGWKSKIVLPNLLDQASYPLYSVVANSPAGEQRRVRLSKDAYLGIVAATNFKQRTRRMLEYYHGDRLQYAVVGTPNRLEYDQGFFVKGGDGLADLKPIAHLYKSQVYQLAAYLGIPLEIQQRRPTTDTYSLNQSQEEFYFSIPLEKFDLCLLGKNAGFAAAKVAPAAGLTADQVARVYDIIDAKRRATRYLHVVSLLAEPVSEIDPYGVSKH
jgi:NAD+ synthase